MNSPHFAALAAARSVHYRLRGLRFRTLQWGSADQPLLIYLHGWLDVAASFAPVAHALAARFHVIALDQRGYGYSEWPADGYWHPDYVADLDALITALNPSSPFTLVGHSMGAQVAAAYAGLRSARVQRLALLDGLALPDMPPDMLPKRFAQWLDQVQSAPRERNYPSFAELAKRIQKTHPSLSAESAEFVAHCWGHQDADGSVRLLADPKHRRDMPTLFRESEARALWQQVKAPTLFVDADDSALKKWNPEPARLARLACFAEHERLSLPGGHMLHFDQPEALARLLLEKL